MTKKDIEKLIIDYGNFRDKVKTFEELIPYETNLIDKLNKAINYTRCCTELRKDCSWCNGENKPNSNGIACETDIG